MRRSNLGGAFSHSMGTAPIMTLFILGTPLKTTHLQEVQGVQEVHSFTWNGPGSRNGPYKEQTPWWYLPLSCPTPGKTVPRHPLGDGCQVTAPQHPLGEPHYHHTRTFSGTEIALQNGRIQWQDCLAFTLIRDAAICITVL